MMALMSVPHRFRIRVSRNSSNNDINFLYVVSHEAQYEVLASDFAPLHSHWYFRRFVFYQLQNIRKQIFTFYFRVMQWVICYPYRQFVKQFLIVYITWCCYSALWLFDKLVHIFILLIYCLAVTYLGGVGMRPFLGVMSPDTPRIVSSLWPLPLPTKILATPLLFGCKELRIN